MEEKSCRNCKFVRRTGMEEPCCICHGKSEWKRKEPEVNTRRTDNFKQFLKELAALSDKYSITSISADNDRVLFESNGEIASMSLLKLCGNDEEWGAMGMSVTTKPASIYFDKEDN